MSIESTNDGSGGKHHHAELRMSELCSLRPEACVAQAALNGLMVAVCLGIMGAKSWPSLDEHEALFPYPYKLSQSGRTITLLEGSNSQYLLNEYRCSMVCPMLLHLPGMVDGTAMFLLATVHPCSQPPCIDGQGVWCCV